MTMNIGTIDRILRLVLGLVALVAGALAFSGGTQIALIVVGVVLIATAGMRFCPAYRLLGIQTCKL